MQGGKILVGGSVIESEGNFVQPTIVEINPNANVVKEELFGPVLYVMKFQVALSVIYFSVYSLICYHNKDIMYFHVTSYSRVHHIFADVKGSNRNKQLGTSRS